MSFFSSAVRLRPLDLTASILTVHGCSHRKTCFPDHFSGFVFPCHTTNVFKQKGESCPLENVQVLKYHCVVGANWKVANNISLQGMTLAQVLKVRNSQSVCFNHQNQRFGVATQYLAPLLCLVAVICISKLFQMIFKYLIMLSAWCAVNNFAFPLCCAVASLFHCPPYILLKYSNSHTSK